MFLTWMIPYLSLSSKVLKLNFCLGIQSWGLVHVDGLSRYLELWGNKYIQKFLFLTKCHIARYPKWFMNLLTCDVVIKWQITICSYAQKFFTLGNFYTRILDFYCNWFVWWEKKCHFRCIYLWIIIIKPVK